MGPLEILSKSCRKGGAGSLRSLARDALARDFCAPLALFSRNLQAGYVIVAGMRGYARKLLTINQTPEDPKQITQAPQDQKTKNWLRKTKNWLRTKRKTGPEKRKTGFSTKNWLSNEKLAFQRKTGF